MESVRYIFRLTCAYWITHLRTPGSELRWYLAFELDFLVDMVIVAPVGYPLGYSINMLLGLALCNWFGTQEGSLVIFLLGKKYGLIIATG